MTLILGIETSCDETAAAVVENGNRMLSNVVASQIETHKQYGGVFPEVAARMHVETISPVIAEAMKTAGVTPAEIDAIAVTNGPGLAGSLLVGVNFAKGLALGWDKPLLGINHIEGHIYSLWLTEHSELIRFPVLCLVVSGGHTELILMRNHADYEMMGNTLDDAAGEAYDKVGRLLGLPYPGGPSIEKAARDGDSSHYDFCRPTLEESLNFSFSGLKTLVMRTVQPQPVNSRRPRGSESMTSGILKPDINIHDIAASFQIAAVAMLVEKTVRAAKMHQVTEILMAGGVSANTLLRSELRAQSALPVRYPPIALCTDNAAMIAAAGFYRFQAGERSTLALDVLPMRVLAPSPSSSIPQ